MLYYYHWKSGHKEGYSPLPYTRAEIERIFTERRQTDPEVTYELIEAEEK